MEVLLHSFHVSGGGTGWEGPCTMGSSRAYHMLVYDRLWNILVSSPAGTRGSRGLFQIGTGKTETRAETHLYRLVAFV